MNTSSASKAAQQRHAPTLHLQGGRVIDPAHPHEPATRDLWIHEGKIAHSLPPEVQAGAMVIDASNHVIMAGGVDMHTHIASAGVNTARELQGDGTFQGQSLIPSTTDTGLRYSAMGYTTAIEAAVAPSDASHAHLQLRDIPNIDTGLLVLVDNHALLMELLAKDDYPGARDVVSELLYKTGAMGMKVVNPAGVASWRDDASVSQISQIDQPLPGASTSNGKPVTPRKILQTLTQISEDLNLPHPTHIHGNRLGLPGNFQTLIDSLKAIEGRRAHVAHLQFYGYGQTAKGHFTSAAQALCDFLDEHPNVTADVGMVMFGPAMTVTADTPLEYGLWRQTGSAGRPAVFCESEREAGLGVMPTSWSQRNRIHSLQWAIGLELMLLMKNPWQISLTIDHPNGGSFLHFPTIIDMLMNKPLRDAALAKAHPYARKHSSLATIDREMTLEEIAILTRAAPARMLGLADRGHLAPGSVGDVTIYRQNAQDNTQDVFAQPAWVIKKGHIVAEQGRNTAQVPGTQLRARLSSNPQGQKLLETWQLSHASYSPGQFGLRQIELAPMLAVQRIVD